MAALPAAASVIVPAGHPQLFQPRPHRGCSSHLQLFQPEAQWPLHVGGLSCPATTHSVTRMGNGRTPRGHLRLTDRYCG